jgi:hypothetical protein
MSQREATRETKAFTVHGMTCAHCVLDAMSPAVAEARYVLAPVQRIRP